MSSSAKKRSPIWQYFDTDIENPKFCVCLLCQIQISRGAEGKKPGTSAMRNHLKTKHPENFQLMKKDKTKVITTPHTEQTIPGTINSPTWTEQQFTLSESFEEKLLPEVRDKNNAKTKKYHYLIAEMIALDNVPLDIVEKVGFTRFLQQALPGYELPSHTYISQKVFPDIYSRIFEKIKIRISDAVAVSITSDIWNCLHKNSNFLSLTAHWLSPEFQFQHGVLAMKKLSGSYNGKVIAKELNSITARWDIEQSKIHILVHNSGTNLEKGGRVAEYDSAQCFIHTFQRVVTEALEAQPEVTDMITVGRSIVKYFNDSKFARQQLLAVQKQLRLPEHQLVEDTSTRWNSTFYMADRLLEQRQAIILYVAIHGTFNDLTSQQWCLMEQCVELLKPFEEITKIMSSNPSCISEVIPHIVALINYLDNDETAQRSADLIHMRVSLKAELEYIFNSIREDPNYLIATFLDPRFKTNFLGTDLAERARQEIELEYITMTCDESSCSGSSSTSPKPAKRYRGNKTDSSFTHESHEIFSDRFNKNNSQCGQENSAITGEMDSYLNTIRIDRNRDPYKWWSANLKQYPHLSKFAKVYLSAPCSSIYSERLFSEAGLVYENRRNRLIPGNGEYINFIQHNLPLINFKY